MNLSSVLKQLFGKSELVETIADAIDGDEKDGKTTNTRKTAKKKTSSVKRKASAAKAKVKASQRTSSASKKKRQ